MKVSRLCCFIAFVILLVLAAAGCGSGGGGAPSTKGKQQQTLSNKDQPGKPTEEQAGAPFYPGSVFDVGMTDVWRFHTSDSYDKVIAFYKAKLPGATTYNTQQPSGRSTGFSYQKNGHSFDVSIQENFPLKGYTEIVISIAR